MIKKIYRLICPPPFLFSPHLPLFPQITIFIIFMNVCIYCNNVCAFIAIMNEICSQ